MPRFAVTTADPALELLRHFCRAKENKWCPPWVARNFEACNPDDDFAYSDCAHEEDAPEEDAVSVAAEVRQEEVDAASEGVFPHGDQYQQHYVFDEVPGDAAHSEEEEAARPATAQPHWRQENREPWQLHSELGPNVGAEAGHASDFGMSELVNPHGHDWMSPLWSEFSHRTAHEFWERLKSADECYTDESLDMRTLNDDDQMLLSDWCWTTLSTSWIVPGWGAAEADAGSVVGHCRFGEDAGNADGFARVAAVFDGRWLF